MPLTYGMRDPFAEINARLRKLGLQPISMGGAPTVPDYAAILQRPLGMPSPMEEQQAVAQQAQQAGPMYNQLTPEAEAGVIEKIGGKAMSGLGWLGTKLDTMSGGRGIRGALGGNLREAATTASVALPMLAWSDEVGLTNPKDIVGGRDLLEQWGLLKKNKSGMFWNTLL